MFILFFEKKIIILGDKTKAKNNAPPHYKSMHAL